ncbi:hypothetical protein CcaverHIS002_0305900 [Cutaneotrichosporon cavernicola]|uniref:Uncharacterized protein n=1 Tax=Cutaneotrichosporon cavernicola TaxID=279322 RepID=A0AA48L202_9TREE|nr:uncharacterized protein CcaverHIS019_0305850 [Cutaneotrichosporon cavernicola]BEI82722.1 hypothetical protein CcaverHIS002_0305900 [Cutaneotrichosporon cavernicola]BEI90515.1 hypothetical protein CcaverHIS019_0305850 [Cutaneotrichosporon cavernicola]BEI98289.1 hypothetical protein CcaverHIS631_0305880 [Cutaneotrichosporon cavernicola]BEJ06064.1 hypothetical protein CcaverHIS641_0305860 [Cutaneotrichosporon cavernicola]
MSASQIGPISQQYAAAATVPLIKSPSLWLPPPVELPSDIHPLPEDITAYFVYPFTLEQHVVSLQPPPHVAIAERRARNAAILHAREVEEEEREKAALHKVAPGYNPAAMLMPTHRDGAPKAASPPMPSPKKEADPMDELVAQLEEMESSKKLY